MLILIKLLAKYVITIHALSSAEPFQIETGLPNWFIRRTFHIRFGSRKDRRLNRALDDDCSLLPTTYLASSLWLLLPWMHPRRKYGWKLSEVIQQSSDLGVKRKQTTWALLYIVTSTKWSRDSNWVTRLVTSKVDFRTIQIQCKIKFIWSLFYRFLLYSVGAHHNRFRCSKTDWITFCFPQNEQQWLEPVFLFFFLFCFVWWNRKWIFEAFIFTMEPR